ncbi:cysteinyl-tRNA synthetase [Peptostreptococcus russellii]|uniref:Cysteine--tRNA ligase n=1 Tax=Peptostreptococcus russellii TaxID=215200 RepID=A0A1H8JAK5_9FIRM|nr:cysteine--tRNA ligase [Peptostreptococcus russellii]SEN77794.1 cysteinyl-tRNA synthetase [Peptostreptococcus russellii]
MKIYNTMTRKKEEFIPLEEGKVKMYVCGPTVYNFIHLGNARPFTVFDALRRYFEYKGYEVTYIQNFTDVDDKIIKRSHEEGITPEEVAKKYINEYFIDCDGLGIKRATVHPQVTDNIENIIEFISDLIEKGYAYESNGDVLFRTRKFDEYGKLSHQNIEELELGARIDIDEKKEDPLDFVLWKAKKEGEPGWKSPWGEGRPGWHIECSVMSRRYLGNTIDIHAGGQDLQFPHHENEIAQSECCNDTTFARYWMHNGYINVDGEKMSKSLGNFFTVREISEKYDLGLVRFFLLSTHYRNPVNFSDTILEQAKSGLDRLMTAKERAEYTLSNLTEENVKDEEKELMAQIDTYRDKFTEAMDDDLNTADAISAIFELAKFMNTNIKESSSKEFVGKCIDMFNELTGVLNIAQGNDEVDDELTNKVEEMIAKRAEAKKNKDFALADQIRDELTAMGIAIEDTRQGVKWKRI